MRKSGLVGLLMLFACGSMAVESSGKRTLEFDVLLEGKPVGSHRYEFRSTGPDSREVLSVAEFKVRFLFFTAYSYEHRAEERWEDGCLAGIDARTNSDGKKTEVSGERTGDGFVVRTDDERKTLSGCVMTFAYWNPEFLDQPRLLNPQTGEYLDVEVQKLEAATTTLSGETVRTNRYRITARDMDITVFYSPDDEWLALESTVKGGRILRYELMT
jgi:hypothetical protein